MKHKNKIYKLTRSFVFSSLGCASRSVSDGTLVKINHRLTDFPYYEISLLEKERSNERDFALVLSCDLIPLAPLEELAISLEDVAHE